MGRFLYGGLLSDPYAHLVEYRDIAAGLLD